MKEIFNEEAFEFESKIYTKSKVTFPFYRKLTYTLIVIYTILILITSFKDGFSLLYTLKHIATYLLCYIAILYTNPKNGYQIAIARIYFDDNKFTATYGNQNDEAAYIPSTANVSIFYNNIIEFKYDNLLEELFIKELNEKNKDEAFSIIYIPEKESNLLMNHILHKCSLDENEDILEILSNEYSSNKSISI